MADDDDIPDDHELFDTKDVDVKYERSKDLKKVVSTMKSKKEISEMRLYLILVLEVEKLERRLGIADIDDTIH